MNKLPLDFTIEKYDTFLRLVDIDDASFILSLRTNINRNKNISFVSNDLGKQIKWIEDYKVREKRGEEYYFLVGDKDKKFYGTTRLYHFSDNIYTNGSWIFSEQTPDGLAIKGDIIGREIGFDILGFDICHFDVRKKNKNVIKYHMGFQPKKINETELDIYFELTKASFADNKLKILKILGYGT
jgi:hypothetical protein